MKDEAEQSNPSTGSMVIGIVSCRVIERSGLKRVEVFVDGKLIHCLEIVTGQ